jgi:hypothetical protein
VRQGGTVEIRPIAEVAGLPAWRPLPVGHDAGDGAIPYMLLCYDDEAAWRQAGPEAYEAALAEAVGLTWELDRAGRFLAASPLHDSDTATCVRVQNGRRSITDGPFTETHEVLGGFYLIRAESSDEALRVAARHPGARLGSVEVRPLFDLSSVEKNEGGPVDLRLARSTI